MRQGLVFDLLSKEVMHILRKPTRRGPHGEMMHALLEVSKHFISKPIALVRLFGEGLMEDGIELGWEVLIHVLWWLELCSAD